MLSLPLAILVAFALKSADEPVWVIDTVLIAPTKKTEVIDYYRSAWLPARREAKRTKLILDYQAILLDEDPREGQKIFLLTKFACRKDVDAAEPTWQRILKQVAPNGPVLPPGLKSNDLRTIIRSDKGIDPFSFSGNH
jgi:hypothetical protein